MKKLHQCKPAIRLVAAALLCLMAATTSAQESEVNSGLRIGSGPDGKVYQLLVNDMKSVCGGTVPIVNVPSIGGIPNLMALSASKIDLGIVQLDTLNHMKNDGEENIQTLQAVMPLHGNMLHILSLRAGYKLGESSRLEQLINRDSRETKVVTRFSHLKGLRIAAVGSTSLLGDRLNKQLGYGMDIRKAETDDEAIHWLKQGVVQAVFTDGGWPMPSIERHKTESGLQLVEYDVAPPAQFSVVKRSYINLDAFKLPFLASPNMLVTRPFKPGGEMGKKVAALQSCLLKNLETLQEGRFHAAWKEIKNPTDTLGIPRFISTAEARLAVR